MAICLMAVVSVSAVDVISFAISTPTQAIVAGVSVDDDDMDEVL
ncbi:hypothetical protein [Absicoccus porci]|nr:hypothetical protein [Absicoccus porci]